MVQIVLLFANTKFFPNTIHNSNSNKKFTKQNYFAVLYYAHDHCFLRDSMNGGLKYRSYKLRTFKIFTWFYIIIPREAFL